MCTIQEENKYFQLLGYYKKKKNVYCYMERIRCIHHYQVLNMKENALKIVEVAQPLEMNFTITAFFINYINLFQNMKKKRN